MKKGFTLARGATHVDMPPVHAKAGFTLAEVVITMGIIGVVAALTIPPLQTNMRRKMATVRIKKFYSSMKQMLLLAQDEHGTINGWDARLPTPEYIDRYILPYIKGSKANGNKIYFVDGSSVTIQQGNCKDLYFDYNSDSPPNKVGRDQFIFLLCPDNHKEWCPDEGFCSYRSTTSRNNLKGLKSSCLINPAYCSALLEYYRWEFPPDYPW